MQARRSVRKHDARLAFELEFGREAGEADIILTAIVPGTASATARPTSAPNHTAFTDSDSWKAGVGGLFCLIEERASARR